MVGSLARDVTRLKSDYNTAQTTLSQPLMQLVKNTIRIVLDLYGTKFPKYWGEISSV